MALGFEIALKNLRSEKEKRRLDATQRQGQYNNFLRERVERPLYDALVALEFEPPKLDATRQRIQMALDAIRKELNS